MAGRAREQQLLAAIGQVLDADERVLGRARCWVAVRRPRVPLLVLGRRQHDAFLTDRRLVLVARRRRSLHPADVLLVRRLDGLTLVAERARPTLRQQRIVTDTRVELVLEWPRRSRAMARALAGALHRPARPAPATTW